MLTFLVVLANISVILNAYIALYVSIRYIDYLKMKKSNNEKIEN